MKGKCLCGKIEIETETTTELGLCHCAMCRRWSGGPMFAVHAGSNVTISGDTIKRYDSSEWAERAFCTHCGTHLFYYLKPNNEYVLTAGLFQDQDFNLSNEIFIDEKPTYYSFSNQTEKLTGQQVFELYTGKE
ncbi:GFA family protein [Gayadomonas joobiniege]|uniref:GFA family protein n=1 Tax=Gayadomonas joobiniege TaxID=1234606 RepID=UPI000380BD0A|nr:GFA family protein [Gayadomonas joobiniege]